MPVQEKILSPKQNVEVVTFRLGNQIYALPIAPVHQIIEMISITPLPQVNPMIVGVINFHGAMVPVINMRFLLGLEELPYTLHTPIILINIAKRLIGLIVDNVLDVLERPSDQVVDTNKILLEEMGETPLLKGLIQAKNKSILVLDPEQLFKPLHTRALSEAIHTLTKSVEQKSAEETVKPQDTPTVDQRGAEESVKPQDTPTVDQKGAEESESPSDSPDSEEHQATPNNRVDQDAQVPLDQASPEPVQSAEKANQEKPEVQPKKPSKRRSRRKTTATAESKEKVSK